MTTFSFSLNPNTWGRGRGWLGVGLSLVLAALLLGLVTYSGQAQSYEPADARYDVSGNQLVNGRDANDVIGAWESAQELGGCVDTARPQHDIDRSGCVDVGDAQAILAHWGKATSAQAWAALEAPAVTVTFTVNVTSTESDSNLGDGVCNIGNGDCTLIAAVEQANSRVGAEIINFNIRPGGSCPSGVSLIQIPISTHIDIDDNDDAGMTINGYSQCGASANTGAVIGNAVIKIEVRGNAELNEAGIEINSSNNVIRGLAIYNSWRNINIEGIGANSNIIAGNFIGTNAAQTFFSGGNARHGLYIYRGSSNYIGGVSPADRNIIAGNNSDPLLMSQPEAQNNHIINNYIGFKQNGTSTLTNGGDKIDVSLGASNNWIGGPTTAERNVIGATNSSVPPTRGNDGIEMGHNSATPPSYNHILNNYIGVNALGQYSNVTRNALMGITLEDYPHHNEIAYNVISGNGSNGVRLYRDSNYNHVHHNYIGVGPDGTTAMGNGTSSDATQGQSGLKIEGASYNLVEFNIIANNVEHGIVLFNIDERPDYDIYYSNFNTIRQNSIYNNANQGIRLNPSTALGVPNQDIVDPVLTVANPLFASGTTCPNCLVELYISDKVVTGGSDPAGEGKTFVGSGTANGAGAFTVNITGTVAELQLLTATGTDANGNTSEFAINVYVGNPPPPTNTPTVTSTPTLTPTPTNTATSTTTSTPTNTATNTATATATNTATATATATATHTPTSTRTPTITQTPTASRTPTITPTPTIRKVYLPLLR